MTTAYSHDVFMTERVRQRPAKKNKLQIWSGYLINHDNIVWHNEHFLPDFSLPTILCSFSQLLRETQHLRQLATKMSGMLPKPLYIHTRRWNSSANILLVHWEWSFNEDISCKLFSIEALDLWMTIHSCQACVGLSFPSHFRLVLTSKQCFISRQTMSSKNN